MFHRRITEKCKRLAAGFPVLALVGPRQAGKTTLAQMVFPDHHYVSLEDLDQRAFAQEDPRYFLQNVSNGAGAIIDEVQHVPSLLSYIQTMVDTHPQEGRFILTGSQNFLINERISQTLAGRIAILTLWPLSISELREADQLPQEYETLLFQGGYPRLYAKGLAPQDWYPNYIRTYLERDVRQLQNVGDLSLFQKFVKLCAGRIGQLVNWSDLGRDCGISSNTAKAWMSLLEASYLVFLLQPHHQNFSKRLVKSPKLYFCDTGLACSLLGIEDERQLATHYLRGGLFECLIVSEMVKSRLNRGLNPNSYFWRDQTGHEVDCLLERGENLIPIEIKSSKTLSSDSFKGLDYWNRLTGSDPSRSLLVYGGSADQKRQQGQVISWSSSALETITAEW